MKIAPNRKSDRGADVQLVVGVGAGAGGEEALQQLLVQLGVRRDLSIVFVRQHELTQRDKPDVEQLLNQLVGDHSFRVVICSQNQSLEPNTVYIAPPTSYLTIKNGILLIVDSVRTQSIGTPIDYFFDALAKDQADRSVGIILSGAGTDGTLGLKSISKAGGLTFSQTPETAVIGSMPMSAIASGVVDHILEPSQIAEELDEYACFISEETPASRRNQLVSLVESALPRVAEILHRSTSHNFQHYKSSTLCRRIVRRMLMLKMTSVDEYIYRLSENVDEAHLLFQELLIGVTEFFRDPDAFATLSGIVLPKIFQNRQAGETVRIWVPGCSSGQEAYSLAMLCREQVELMSDPPEVQIFATDIDHRALQRARAGIYPLGIQDEVPPDRLSRFFLQRGKRFHVVKEIRELVLFSIHNLINDPPFSRQDLISCRNLLIYLGPHLQLKLIPLFHYALRPAGYLFLGPSENIASHQELFSPVDVKHRISQRKETAIGNSRKSTIPSSTMTQDSNRFEKAKSLDEAGSDEQLPDLLRVMQRIVLDEFAPKSVLVNREGKILCASGDMHKYLTVSSGSFENNLFKLARAGLRIGLRAALAQSAAEQRRVLHECLSTRIDGMVHPLNITVQPMPELGEGTELFLVVFQDIGQPIQRDEQSDHSKESMYRDGGADAIIEQLEKELAATREDLERSLQDMEAANEEMKSSNEELLSMNEELQSANEELETSKEDIQAAVAALEESNSHLENLLRSTQIATIFLDKNLVIRSFTPAATAIYALIPTDVGRPLEHLRPLSEQMPHLPSLDQVRVAGNIEHAVNTHDGRYYVRRVMPYRLQDGEYAGIVVTFTDFTEFREVQKSLELRERQLQTLTDATPAMIAYVDAEERYQFVNQTYCDYFARDSSQLVGRTVGELIGEVNYKEVAPWLQRALAGNRVNYEYPLRRAETLAKQNATSHSNQPLNENELRDAKPSRSEAETEVGGPESNSAPRMPDVQYKDVTYVPDIDESGRVLGCYVFINDVTERTLQSLELADREERLSSLISSTAEGIYGMDSAGRCTFVNNACVRLLGYQRAEELLGKPLHELVHHSHADGSTYPSDDCLIHKAVQQRKEVHVDEEVFWRADGTCFDVEYWSYPQCRNGEIVGCVVTFLDVTERRRWERELEDREAHLRRVIDNMLGFVGVLETDGTLCEANKPAIEAAGVSREELIGKKFWDCHWWNHDKATQTRLQDAIRLAAKGEVQRYDAVIRMADDSRITIGFMLTPVRDAQGKVTHLIPSGIDISERLRAERAYRKTARAVRDNEERLAMALRAGGMAAWEWNPNQSIWTDELYQLLGIPSTETAAAETLFRYVHEDDLCRLEKGWNDALAHGTSFEQEFRILRPDGQLRWLNWLGKVVCNDVGKVVRIFGLSWDSTQGHLAAEALRESERRAQEANLSKSEFIANMSHEIRTPMTAVLGYTDLLAAQEQDPEKTEHLRTIKRNGSFLLEIINDILDLSKIEAGKLDIDRQEFSPHEVFADVYSMMDVRARAFQLDFSLEYQTLIPAKIRSDPKRLKQILVNLVGNAIKFTESGSVKLVVRFEAQSQLRFEVIDTGIGMSSEQQQRLFQPFSQGDASVTRKFGGTGLGLAISRRLAKMLGGEITFYSELGKGSAFSCSIDTGEIDDIEMISPTPHLIVEVCPEKNTNYQLDCRILVVDDRRDVRFLTKHFLVKAGATVELAEDGQHAVELIERSCGNESPAIDLVLLDMQMPRLDGYATARALRKMGFTKPIIALTADAMHGDMTRCIECGCDSYLSKPINGPALLKAVAEYMLR